MADTGMSDTGTDAATEALLSWGKRILIFGAAAYFFTAGLLCYLFWGFPVLVSWLDGLSDAASSSAILGLFTARYEDLRALGGFSRSSYAASLLSGALAGLLTGVLLVILRARARYLLQGKEDAAMHPPIKTRLGISIALLPPWIFFFLVDFNLAGDVYLGTGVVFLWPLNIFLGMYNMIAVMCLSFVWLSLLDRKRY